ncbi:MAG: glycosyltransferase family 2 protein [Methanomassiliicoccales archaeon]|nr:MAG: glycosyltransferase family 2 protein [Methanomassiliicoccales archaeon]
MNEEESIGEVMDTISDSLREFEGDYEVAVVDTESKDRTVEIAKSKGARVIDEPRRGYGRAYKTGFERAKGEIIATLDADCTYPAEDIPKLVKMLEDENLDFITCDRLSRLEKGVMSAKHRFGNWVLKVTTNILFGMRIKDSQSGMWVFRKKILDKIELTSDGMPLSEEIKIEAWRKGFRAKEVPIAYRMRKGEVKLQSWNDGFKNLKFLFRKRFRKKGAK